METLLHDLRFGFRQMRLSPGFTIVAVLTLALGIGGTTMTFSAINALYLRPPAVEDPRSLVGLVATDKRGNESPIFDYSVFRALRGEEEPARLAAYSPSRFGLGGGESAEVVLGEYASASYFTALRARPQVGRFFTEEDDRPGAAPVAVVSDEIWRRRFGARREIVGMPVTVNGVSATIVGVAARGFNGASRAVAPEVWIPLELHPHFARNAPPGFGNLALVQLFARLNGEKPEQLRDRLSARLRAAPRGFGPMGQVESIRTVEFGALPGPRAGGTANPVSFRFYVSFLMLLIACTNVVGMMLARAGVRRREIAIRMATGARRSRIVRQLLTESTLLFLLGAAGGVLLTVLASGIWSAASVRSDVPMRVTLDYSVDARVLAFALVTALATSVVFGLVPATRAAKTDIAPVLGDSLGSTPGGTRARDTLVVAQVAASCFLLVCAGLLIRGLERASRHDPGFRTDRIVTGSIDLDLVGYPPARGEAFHARLLERLRADPAVESASLSSSLPFGITTVTQPVRADGAPGPDGSGETVVRASAVDPDFFAMLAIPLLRGRLFNTGDQGRASPVAIVSKPMAERFWPGEDPVGKTLHSGPKSFQVVGVVRGIETSRLGEGPQVHLYLPSGQGYASNASVLVRARGNPAAAAAALRREVAKLDPAIPVMLVSPLGELVGESIAGERFTARVVGAFALLSLLLAATGLYGSVSYVVLQRTRELGVRMAVGARPGDIAKLVLGKGLGLALAGIAAGLVVASASSRLVASRLHGISAFDPLSFAGVSLLLVLVAVVSSIAPTRRALRLDPFAALRDR